jgi:hypothetical protein
MSPFRFPNVINQGNRPNFVVQNCRNCSALRNANVELVYILIHSRTGVKEDCIALRTQYSVLVMKARSRDVIRSRVAYRQDLASLPLPLPLRPVAMSVRVKTKSVHSLNR